MHDPVQSLDWEDPLEKGMATHSSILVWRIPWTEEHSRRQSMEKLSSMKLVPAAKKTGTSGLHYVRKVLVTQSCPTL